MYEINQRRTATTDDVANRRAELGGVRCASWAAFRKDSINDLKPRREFKEPRPSRRMLCMCHMFPSLSCIEVYTSFGACTEEFCTEPICQTRQPLGTTRKVGCP